MGTLVETDSTSHSIVLAFTLCGFPIVIPMGLTLIFYTSVIFLPVAETISEAARVAIHCEVLFGTLIGVSLWASNRQLESLLKEALEAPYILTNHSYIRQIEAFLFPWIRSMLYTNGLSSILDSRDILETSPRTDIGVDDDSNEVSAEYNPPITARVGFHCWPTAVPSNLNMSQSSKPSLETPKRGQDCVNLKWVMGFPQFPKQRHSEPSPLIGQDTADLLWCQQAAGYSRPIPIERIIFLQQRQRRRMVTSKAATSVPSNSHLGGVLQRIAQYIRDCSHERRPLSWPSNDIPGQRWSLQMGGFLESEFRTWHEQIFSRLRTSRARRLPMLQQLALLTGDLTANVLLVRSVRSAWSAVSHGPQISSFLAVIWSNTAVTHCAYLVKRVAERRHVTYRKTIPVVFCESIALVSMVVRVGAVYMFPMEIPDPILYMYAQLVLHHGVISAISSHTFLKKYILERIIAVAAIICLSVIFGGLLNDQALDRVIVQRTSHRSKLHGCLRLRP